MSTQKLASLACIRGAPPMETRMADRAPMNMRGVSNTSQKEIEKRVLERLRKTLSCPDSGQLVAVVPLYQTVDDERRGKGRNNSAIGSVQVGPTLNISVEDLFKVKEPDVQDETDTRPSSAKPSDKESALSSKYSSISAVGNRTPGRYSPPPGRYSSAPERYTQTPKPRKVTFADPPAEKVTLSTDQAVKTKPYAAKKLSQRGLVKMLKKLNCGARPIDPAHTETKSRIVLQNPVYVPPAHDDPVTTSKDNPFRVAAPQPPQPLRKVKSDPATTEALPTDGPKPMFIPWSSWDTGSTCSTITHDGGEDESYEDDESDIWTEDEESIRQQLYGLLKEAREDPWQVFSIVNKEDVEETSREVYRNPWLAIR